MGGKTQQSTSQVTVPPEVLARYNAVNNLATQVGNTPFQQYSTDPNAFVAPVNAEQQAGIAGTNNFATAAQPYNAAATGYALAGGNAVDPSNLDAASIGKYLSPYLGTVLGSTAALLNQNNQQQQGGQLGDAIKMGAFGGDRAGIAAANLEQQQNLGNASIYSGIANQGYNTALQTAEGQQAIGLGAGQANRAATQATADRLASLGQLGQTEGLQGAQAQLGAGGIQQQTTQAGDTALYNQFLQQQSYPFQVAQFEANIAEGTGALSGSTTTTTQPQSIFSDERLKEDVRNIGKTFGGQNVVAFRYKGDPTRRIGLIAQDVEKKHPEAVHDVGGFKAVDYDKATDADARKGHFYKGGLVHPANDNRDGYAYGGTTSMDPMQLAMLNESYGTYGNSFGPYSSGGLYGTPSGGQPRGGLSYVPQANLPVGRLAVAQPPAPPPSALSQAEQVANLGSKITSTRPGQAAMKSLGNLFQSPTQKLVNDSSGREEPFYDSADMAPVMARGGFARLHRDSGGQTNLGGNADLYGGGLDIPDDTPKNLTLATAKPPQQSSSGLGDILKLAETAASFIPLKDGGVARKGYDDGGAVDPNTSWNPLDGLKAIGDALAPQVKADPSSVVPATDPLTAAVHYGMKLGSQAVHGLESLTPDQQMGAAGAMSGADPVAGVAGGMTGGDDFGSALGLPSGGDTAAAGVPRRSPQAGRAVRAARSAPTGPQVGPAAVEPDATAQPPTATMAPGINPNPDLAAAPQVGKLRMPASQPNADGSPSDEPGIVQSALAHLGGHGMHFDRDTILPILSAIAAAGAVPTVHPGVALAAGLGAYANSAMNIRQQEAEIARTQAGAGLEQSQAFHAVQPPPPAGTMMAPGPGPDGKFFIGPDGKQYHYAVQGEMIGNAPTATNAAGAAVPAGTVGATPAGQPRKPITSDYTANAVTLGPSSAIDTQMQRYGIDPSQPGVANRARAFALNPALEVEDAAGMKLGQDAVAAQPAADNTQRNLIQLATAVNSLPKEGLQAPGAGFEDRQHLANIYQTASNILGITPDPGVSAATDASQIIEKIKTLSGMAMAHQNDERAASIAQALTAVLPGGSHQIGAADEVLANMMVQNQRDRDFPAYFHNYVAKYGTAAGVQQAFQADMNPDYMSALKTLPKVMGRRADGKLSPAEMLMADPSRTKAFEQGGARSDGTAYPGFGEGIARYWR